jgi:hypothetical protein
MASAKSLKALAVMEANTVFTSDTFCGSAGADIKSADHVFKKKLDVRMRREGSGTMLLPVMIRQL